MLSSLFLLTFAQSVNPGQANPVDTVATKTIQDETTDPRFITDWVATLPQHQTVPSPRDILGYTVGAEGELTHVDDIHRYFRALAEASPRVKLFSAGKSEEGREMLIAAIADEETLDNLDRYKEITRALADPANLKEGEAGNLIQEGKPIYWITAGLHSTELGPPETAMELAYRIAVDERETFQNIRNNIITLITPVLEVDGRARQVEWTKRHLSEFEDYEDTVPKSPPFWGHYTFHDNNRDGLTMSQPLTQNYVNGFFDWMPTLSLDLHESVPLLYVSTGTGPYNRAVDPITITEWQSIANYEVASLTAAGMPGVWSWGFYTGWFPGYMLWVTNNHNANGRFYETFGNHVAKTVERDITNRRFANDKITDKTWYRADPPKRKFKWSMRNNANFMQSGVISSLQFISKSPKDYLRNFHTKNINAMSRAVEEAPYAFAIPIDQKDRNAAHDLLNLLRQHGIDVSVAGSSFGKDDNAIKRGDLIVKLNQRYGPLAQNLLENQKFPEKVQVSPYDDVAWTLGLQMGVEVKPIDDKDILDHTASKLNLESNPFSHKSYLSGSGQYIVIPHHGQNELGPLRFSLAEQEAYSAKQNFKIGSTKIPAGSLIIDTEGMKRADILEILSQHELKAYGLRRLPKDHHKLDVPRIGLLHSWTDTQNAGWVRYALDQSKVPFTIVDKDRARQGNLSDEFDVIIAPAFRGGTTARQLIGGIDQKWSPLAYNKTDATPSHGLLVSADDITGGFGFTGMAEVEKFIRGGGTFIGLHSGGVLAAETGLTQKISVSRPGGLNTPGSVLSAKITGTGPLTYGFNETTHIFRTNGPIYRVADNQRSHVSLQFGNKIVPEPFEDEKEKEDSKEKDKKKKAPPLVRSGAILSGKQVMDGAPALLNENVGDGQVILFSWNPLHRNINHHDHAFFYNAVLHWNDL